MIFSVIRVFLLFFFLSCPPLGIASDLQYIAVWDNITLDRSNWAECKPQLYEKAFYWEDLDPFLDKVARRAGNRPIVLDIGCHGTKEGYLCLGSPDGESATGIASFSYLLNRVEEKLKGKNLKCITLEACYSKIVVERSFKVKREYQNRTCFMESYHGLTPIPAYPIYGIGRSPSYNNLVFMQYIKNRKVFFEDLRDAIGHPIEEPIRGQHILTMLSILLTILQSKMII